MQIEKFENISAINTNLDAEQFALFLEQLKKEFLIEKEFEFDPYFADKGDYGLGLITWGTIGACIYETIESGASNGVVYFNHELLAQKLLKNLFLELMGCFGKEYVDGLNKEAEFISANAYVNNEIVHYVEKLASETIGGILNDEQQATKN